MVTNVMTHACANRIVLVYIHMPAEVYCMSIHMNDCDVTVRCVRVSTAMVIRTSVGSFELLPILHY